MTKREYAEQIAEIIGGDVKEIEKANGIKMIGVEKFPEGKNIAPCIYIDKAYEAGLSIADAVEQIKEAIEAAQIDGFDVEFITDFERVKTNLKARLYNKKTSAEVFRSAADKEFYDLIIVPYIEVNLPNGAGGIKVTQALLDKWGKTADEVIDVALENISNDIVVMSMTEMLKEMGYPTDMLPSDDPTKIVTNESRSFGAISVLFAEKELKEAFPNGYLVLPSSVHEVLIMPYNGNDEEVSRMVREVNDSTVDVQEQLGNRAYLFI